jgi:hypothetical protein
MCDKHFSADRIEAAPSLRPTRGAQERESRFVIFPPQCDRGKGFFVWIRCNPLKSPNSAKGIQGNPSLFPWNSLVLFGFAWRLFGSKAEPGPARQGFVLGCKGTVATKEEPWLTRLVIVSLPRWRVRICLTMARPRPVPFLARLWVGSTR